MLLAQPLQRLRSEGTERVDNALIVDQAALASNPFAKVDHVVELAVVTSSLARATWEVLSDRIGSLNTRGKRR